MLAVKPQVLPDVIAGIADKVTADHLIVSIAAGVKIDAIAKLLPAGTRVVRVMPNTPCLVGAGAAGVSGGPHATHEDVERVRSMFEAVGVAFSVPERLLDAVTGVSGSGPAFAYQVIEAMSDGGVLAGLPRDVATKLAAQTLLGAAKMVLETGRHPAELKDMVTSPAGTTIAGLHEMERNGVRAALIDAVQAAWLRAEELGS